MNHSIIIQELERNKITFKGLLYGVAKEEYLWKPEPDKWCLLEILCHLYDEEREDFRARVNQVLIDPKFSLSSINPVGWVTERKYIEKNYDEVLNKFLEERTHSVNWLKSLESPAWKNTHIHPKLGAMSAEMILSNWLAHDYLHFRQIISVKFHYLKQRTGEELSYVGSW